MTYDEVLALVSRLTYKPDWSLFIHNQHLIVSVRVEMLPEKYRTLLTNPKPLPTNLADMAQDEFLAWVQARILELEMHESCEWFRIDARAVFDPHKAGWIDHAHDTMRSALKYSGGN